MAQNERPHLQKLLIKPPLQGLNIHDNPLDLDVNFAYELTNFLPPTTYLEVRPGVRGITTLDGISLGMYSYSVGAIKTYSKGSILKASVIDEPATSFIAIKLLDVSGQVVIYSVKPNESKDSSWAASITELGRSTSFTRTYSTDFCTQNTTLYFTDGGETNAPFMYTPNKAITQMAWKSPATNKYATEGSNITDVENMTAYNGFFYCNSKDSLNIYYIKAEDIDPTLKDSKGWVNRIFTPTATGVINLGGVLQRGGAILKIFTMSAVKENNIAQYLCVITTLGELLVYKGTAPNDTAKWELDGNFTIPVPLNKRSFCNVEGDMIIATETGFVSLHRIIFNSVTKITEALEKRISNLFQQYEFRTSGYKDFFFLQYYHKRRLVIFNVPEMLPASLSEIKSGYEVDNKSVLYLTANYTTTAFFKDDVKDFIINYIYKHSINYKMQFEFDGDVKQGLFFEVTTEPWRNENNPLHLGGWTKVRLYIVEETAKDVYVERDLIGTIDKGGHSIAGIDLTSDNIMWGVDDTGAYTTPPSLWFDFERSSNIDWYGWIGDRMEVLISGTPTNCSVYRFLTSHNITNILSYARTMDLPSAEIMGTYYSMTEDNLGPFFTLTIVKRNEWLSVNGSVMLTCLALVITALTNVIYGRSISEKRSLCAPYVPNDYDPWLQEHYPPPSIYDLGSIYISHTTMPATFNPDPNKKSDGGIYNDDLPLFEWDAMFNTLKKVYDEFKNNPNVEPIDLFSCKIYTDVLYSNGTNVLLYRFTTNAEYIFTGINIAYWDSIAELLDNQMDQIYWSANNSVRFAEVKVKATTSVDILGGKIASPSIEHRLNLFDHTIELTGHLTKFFGWDGELPDQYEMPVYFRYDSVPVSNLVNIFDDLKEGFSSSADYIVQKVEIVKEKPLLNTGQFGEYDSRTIEKIDQIFAEWPSSKVESQHAEPGVNTVHTDEDYVGCGLWFMYFMRASKFDVNSPSRYAGNAVHNKPSLIPFINGLGITRDYKSSQYIFDTNYGTWSKWEGIDMVDAVEHDNEFFFIKLEETTDVAHRKARLCKFDYEYDGDDPWDTGTAIPIVCSYRGGHSDLGVPHLKKQFKIAGIYGSKPAFWTLDIEPPVEFQFSLDFVEQPNVIYPYYTYKDPIPLGRIIKETYGHPMMLAIELDKAGILKAFKDMTYQEKKKYYKIYATLSQQVAYIELPLISNPANRISVGCRMIIKKHGIFIYGYELYFEEVNP
jgi:hypothetical protein